jgi:hypothetical protein
MMDYEYGQELTIQDLPVELLEKILSYNQPNLVRGNFKKSDYNQ